MSRVALLEAEIFRVQQLLLEGDKRSRRDALQNLPSLLATNGVSPILDAGDGRSPSWGSLLDAAAAALRHMDIITQPLAVGFTSVVRESEKKSPHLHAHAQDAIIFLCETLEALFDMCVDTTRADNKAVLAARTLFGCLELVTAQSVYYERMTQPSAQELVHRVVEVGLRFVECVFDEELLERVHTSRFVAPELPLGVIRATLAHTPVVAAHETTAVLVDLLQRLICEGEGAVFADAAWRTLGVLLTRHGVDASESVLPLGAHEGVLDRAAMHCCRRDGPLMAGVLAFVRWQLTCRRILRLPVEPALWSLRDFMLGQSPSASTVQVCILPPGLQLFRLPAAERAHGHGRAFLRMIAEAARNAPVSDGAPRLHAGAKRRRAADGDAADQDACSAEASWTALRTALASRDSGPGAAGGAARAALRYLTLNYRLLLVIAIQYLI